MNFKYKKLVNLESKYGDHFYLLDVNKVKGNYQSLLSQFQRIYSNTHIAYSYKANYLPVVCEALNRLNALAEVVSGMEYDLARRIGVASERIIYNGPCKTYFDVQQALLDGALVNIDSSREVEFIEEVAKLHPDKQFRVGIRCNFQSGGEAQSRFGFDVQAEEFENAFERINNLNNCIISGLHCHYISEERSAEFYSDVSLKMISIAKKYFTDVPPEFINIGGGFYSNMNESLKEQFHFPIPTFEEYALAIANHFVKAFPGSNSPKLVIEPGIALVADAMKFVARVNDVKCIRKRSIALLSGSVYNIKPTKSKRMLPITVISDTRRSSESVNEVFDLVGSTCMEDDVMYVGYKGNLRAGDYILFDNVGAYTIVLKPPFIIPSPAVLCLSAVGDEFELARRAETAEDILSGCIFG